MGDAKVWDMGGHFFRCKCCYAVLLGVAIVQGVASAAHAADALPAGGHFTAGTGSIAGDNNAVSISQSSNTGIIDWNSFSIGSGNSVVIDNGAGATLNRVTGSDLSRIDGLLSATGSAYLINQNGIVIGPGGKVVTGGSFVGSTRDITDQDFLDGGTNSFAGSSSGDVINQGTIHAQGGDAVLIGRNVTNSGNIQAPEGAAAMAAGNNIILQPVGGDRRIYIQGSTGDGDVTNEGAVTAAQAELAAANGNVYALAGNTDGVIRATGSATQDGRVLLTAGGDVSVDGKLAATNADGSGGSVKVRATNINLSGKVDASATASGKNGGDVSVIATGTTDFSGTIKAEGGAGAKGGEVETSGVHLHIADSARVSTLAEGGQSGSWLLDPNDFTIAASGGDITGATLSTNLAGGNVTISSNDGATSGNGDIFVNDAVTWDADTTLTLDAVRNININAAIAASGANAGLALTYGGDYSFANGGTVTLSGASAGLSIGGNAYTLIHNANDLQAINGSGYYALADNVDASGTASWNSGAGFNPIGDFSGILAGLNHAIDGLTINRAGETSVGMFSSTTGRFRDFTMSNVSIVSGGSVGALAYRIEGNRGVSNIHVTGNITSVGGGGQVGGLIGWLDQTTLSDSSSAATVTGFGEVGGLVGRLRAGSITNSYDTGAVTGTTDYVGGLVGSTYQGGTLTNVYASGNVTGTTNVGGLVGGAMVAGTVNATNAYWDVDSTGQSTSYAGTGISNANAYTQSTYSGFDFTNIWVMLPGETRPMLQNEYATTIFTPHQLQLMALDLGADYTLGGNIDMTGAFTANSGGYYGDVWGGLGFSPIGTFTGSLDGQSHKITDLTINRPSTDYVGLFGYVRGGSISNLTLSGGSVGGGQFTGGLVGYMEDGATVSSVASSIAVSSTESNPSNGNAGVGGLVGTSLGGTISGSSASGAVTSAGKYIGGLIGQNIADMNHDALITLSYATGAVTGTSASGSVNIGGFVGANNSGPSSTYRARITQSFANGAVTSIGTTAAYTGGFVGQNVGIISNAYATGPVSAAGGSGANAGGFVGFNAGQYGTYSDSVLIDRAYSTGMVTASNGTTKIGGFAGSDYPYDTNVYDLTNAYWDTDTSGLSTGVGDQFFGSSFVTGQTTAQLQGTLPTNFSSTIWGTGTNLYPYFNWRYSTTPVSVSGIAYSDAGSTVLTGSVVTAVANGASIGSAFSGANGYYYILADSGSIPSTGVLSYLDGATSKGAAFADILGINGVHNLDIYGSAARFTTGEASLSNTLANLTATLGSYADTALDFIGLSSGLSTSTGYNMSLDAASNYLFDVSQVTSGGSLSLTSGATFGVSGSVALTAAGNLTVNSPLSWSDSSALTTSTTNGGNITLDDVTASNGSLVVSPAGTATTDGAIDVDAFVLNSGTWRQIATSLPAFSANDFRLDSGATFVRAIGGNGVAGTPYQIVDVYGLQGMASQSLLGKSFVLASDIDASGTATWNSGAGFDPIGDNSNPFYGSFDGQNHTITGLTINRATTDYVGLFGYTGNNITIKDVVLDGIDITGRKYVGGFIGSFTGDGSLLTGVSTSGKVSGEAYVGGLVGNNANGVISNSDANTDVTATGNDVFNSGMLFSLAGGFAGANTGTILQSHASGTVTGSGNNTGGFVGINSGGSAAVVDSYATGKVKVTSGGSTGGLAGANTGTITRSYATGDVSGVSNVGGLAGLNANGATIATSFATGAVSGSSNLGGLVGTNTQAVISTTYATGSVTGGSGVGGLIGSNYLGNTYGNSVANSYATGAVSGSSSVAGLIGSNYIVSNAYGSVTGSFWNTETTGRSIGVNGTAVDGAIGVDTAGMRTLSTFTDAGWNIDDQGGTSSMWRIYEGQTAPLIRYFMTGLTVTGGDVTKTYDGSAVSTDVGTLAYSPSGYDPSLVFGTAQYTASSADAGSYSGSDLTLGGLYSTQLGYDITSTAGSLTVNKAALTVTAQNDSKTYDGLAYTGGNGVSYSGFVNGEDSSALSGTVSYGGTSQSAIDAGSYTITASGLTSNNYDISYVAGDLTVGKASLTVTADNDSKTYDGLAYTGGNGVTYSGFVNGEDSSVLSGAVSYGGTSQGAVNTGSYTITASGLTSNNYDISYVAGGLTVGKALLTVTASNDNKTYDGLAYTGGNGVTYSGFVNGEDSSVLSGAVSYGGTSQGAVNAGSYTITASGLTSNNYDISYVAGGLTVGKASLTVTADNDSKTYDGLAYTGGNGVTYSGFVNGETSSALSGTVSYGGTSQGAVNAGNYTITASGLTSNNYDISYVAGGLTVGKAALTVTASADNKTYDGNAYSGGNGVTYSGFVNGEDSSVLSGTVSYGGTSQGAVNAGTYSITASGLTSSNYDISYVAGGLTVGKASLTVTASNDNKTYDGLAYTGGNGLSYSGFVNGEDSSVLSGAVSYGGTSQGAVNVGSYTITASGLTSNNYDISYVAGGLTVGKASLTVTANNDSKTYDGLVYTGGNGVSYSGFVNGEDSSALSGTVGYGGTSQGAVNAGSYTITASGLTSNNYDISYVAGGLTVGKALLTVTANNDSKTYDGLAYSGGNGVTYAGFVNGETSSVLSGTLGYGGTAQGAVNAGTYSITASGLGASNYDISYVPGTLSVSKAAVALTITPDTATKVYGDTLNLSNFSASGLIGSDSISSVTLNSAGTAATANVGSYDISASDAVFGTGLASNYDIHYDTLTGGLTVTARPITVTADNLSRLYGASNPTFTWQVTSGSIVNGDMPSGTLTTAAVVSSNVGEYDITQGALDFGSNYALTFMPGMLTINPATLTVTANAQSRNYGDSNPSLTYGYSGFVAGDDASLFAGALTTSADATSNVGTYAIGQGTLSAGGNYVLAFTGANLTVKARPLTVTADDLSRLYGASNPALTWQVTSGNLVNGDTFSGVLATAADASSNVGNYDITQGTLDFGSNYALTFLPGTLMVNPATLVITADDAEKVQGDSIVLAGYSVTGLVTGDDVSDVQLTSTGEDASAPVGTYAIVASNALGHGLSNYDIHYVDGALTVRDNMPALPSDLTVSSIESSPYHLTWDPSQSEVGPGTGVGGFWSLPLFVQAGFSGAADTAGLTTGSINDEDDTDGSDEWELMVGNPGRLNGRTKIEVRDPRIYVHDGIYPAVAN